MGWLVDGVRGGWLGWLVDGLAGWLVGLVGWLGWLGWQVELARAIGFDHHFATIVFITVTITIAVITTITIAVFIQAPPARQAGQGEQPRKGPPLRPRKARHAEAPPTE